jgi:DNA polymerase-3 subunit beta
MLRNTLFAMCPQGTGRPFLEGLFFEVENGLLKITGTDAHRLSSVRANTDLLTEKQEFLLTRKSVVELHRLLENVESVVTIHFNKQSAVFTFAGTTFYAKLTQPKFPNYEAIMPNKMDNIAVLHRIDLLNSLNHLKFLTAEDQRKYVKLTFDSNNGLGSLLLEVENSLHEIGDAEMDIEYTGNKITSTFTQSYLSEYLQATDAEKLFVYPIDEKSALMFREEKDSDNKRFIVMPIRG